MFWKSSKARDGFSLWHPCGLQIERGLREAALSALTGIERKDMQTGYVWYRLPRAEIAGHTLSMSLCFHHGYLDSISVAVADPSYGTGWADWSEDKQKACAAATQRWLATIGYEVGTYPWGVVWAGVDPKTLDGSGGIRFA